MDNGQLKVIGGIAEISSDGIFFKASSKLILYKETLEASRHKFIDIADQCLVSGDGERL